MTKVTDDQKLMYGLEEFKMNGLTLGYIAEDSFDLNGSKGEYTPVRAAQVKGYAVKNLPKTNGTVNPTFELIQFNYENMVKVLGGRVLRKDGKVVGWAAPSALVQMQGFFEIFTDSGHVTVILSALLQGYISGTLTLTDVSRIKCELAPQQPADGSDPYLVLDAGEYTPYDADTDTAPDLSVYGSAAQEGSAQVAAGASVTVAGLGGEGIGEDEAPSAEEETTTKKE